MKKAPGGHDRESSVFVFKLCALFSSIKWDDNITYLLGCWEDGKVLRTGSGSLVCAAAAIISIIVTRKGGQEAVSPLGQFQSHLSY